MIKYKKYKEKAKIIQKILFELRLISTISHWMIIKWIRKKYKNGIKNI